MQQKLSNPVNAGSIVSIFIMVLIGNGCWKEKKSASESAASADSLIVEAKRRIYHEDGTRTYTGWIGFPTRTIGHLEGYQTPRRPVSRNEYGGRKDRRATSTGFFHASKIDGRWWVVDPEGCLCQHIAVNSLSPGRSQRNQKAFEAKFGTTEKWISQTCSLLHEHGFNGAGSWSDADALIACHGQHDSPVSYTVNLNFMSGYGDERGGTYAVPGHRGYPNNTIFVFDDAFAAYCDRRACELVKYKDDPNLFGYFSDNELPFRMSALEGYLKLEASEEGNQAAKQWIEDRGITEAEITDEIRAEFLAYVADRYFNIVASAIRRYDPNHMFLGPRLYSREKNNEHFMRVAGRYVDVLSCNYYNRWTPVAEEINNWTAWSGKPFIITEWYVKGEDSGLPNQSGAGWIVKTQRDRGLFYQNYTLALLESGNCVGWHWFKYQDNDPTLEGAELSNIDSNKGIVNNYFEPYEPCLELMAEINHQVYDLIDYFDRQHR